MKRLVYYISIFLVIFLDTKAQDNQFYLGPVFYYNSIFNKSEIPLYPYSSACGIYENGNSNSLSFGLNAGYILIPNLLNLDTKILYDTRPIGLEKLNNTGLEVFVDNEYQDLVLRHDYEATLKYLMLDIGAKVYPVENLPLGFRLGFDLSTEMFGNSYTNTESIDSPSGILFPDETLRREVEAGELEINSTNYGINISIFGEYDQDTNFIIVPEVSYRHQLNSNLRSVDWYSNALRIGVSAVWYLNLNKRHYIKPEESEISENVDSQLVNPAPITFSNLKINPIDYTETTVTQTYPLLPYIFFDSASHELDSDIILKKKFEDEKALPKNNIDIYYYMPDIIGKRLEDNPKFTLTIVGTTDGLEISDSTKRQLAINRANSVKEYILDKYDVYSSQIIIKSNNIPEKISSMQYIEGIEENRRVELYSDDIELFNPVIHQQFAEYSIKSKDLYLETEIDNHQSIRFMQVEVLRNDTIIHTENISSTKNIFRYYNSNISDLMKIYGDYAIRITARDSISNEYSIHKQIPTNLNMNEYELARLNLIVFDFDSDYITEVNQNYLDTFLSSQIAPEAKIRITGSTDILGGYEYNLELSQRRADAVKKVVLKYANDSQIVSCEGKGSDNIKFDITTPEGRFYCRTVLVEVMNPIK